MLSHVRCISVGRLTTSCHTYHLRLLESPDIIPITGGRSNAEWHVAVPATVTRKSAAAPTAPGCSSACLVTGLSRPPCGVSKRVWLLWRQRLRGDQRLCQLTAIKHRDAATTLAVGHCCAIF